jgi:hypothetical protein
MEFKQTIDLLRNEATLNEDRSIKLETEKSELKKMLQEARLKAGAADE